MTPTTSILTESYSKLPIQQANPLSSLTAGESSVLVAANTERGKRFSPYVNNGGTLACIAGPDYAVLAADTRLSTGFSIHTRHHSKFTQLTPRCIIASSGMQSDIAQLHKVLLRQVKLYEATHRRSPSIGALSQLVSTTLYFKRFFVYYAFNALVGLSDEGDEGAVYNFDAVGSFERLRYTSQGTGSALAMSILDNKLGITNRVEVPPVTLSKEESIDLLQNVLNSVCERDIFTGDDAEIVLVEKRGISIERIKLRKD